MADSIGLETVLTLGELKALAGEWFTRGQIYHRRGRVERCDLSHGEARGLVRGSQTYQVHLYVDRQHSELGFNCSCPLGEQDLFCKHAIAFGLAVLEAFQRTKRVTTENPLLSSPPKNGQLKPLWDALVAARRPLSSKSRGRSSRTPQEVRLNFDPELPGFRGKVPSDRRYEVWGRSEHTVQLRWKRGHLETECDCELYRNCDHLPIVLDTALSQLKEPQREQSFVQMAEEIFRPEWARALTALSRLAAKDREGDASEEIACSWQLHERGLLLEAQPLIHKKTKKGGWSSGSRIGPEKLLHQHGAALEPRDLQLCTELIASRRRGTSEPAALLQALVGHPRVFLKQDRHTPIEVRRTSLGFVVRDQHGQLSVAPALDGIPLTDDEQRLLAIQTGRGPLCVLLQPRAHVYWLVEVNGKVRALTEILARHGSTFPAEAAPQLTEQLFRLEGAIPWTLPDSLKGEAFLAPPTAILALQLEDTEAGLLRVDARVCPLPGGQRFSPGEGPTEVYGTVEGRRVFAQRVLNQEVAWMREKLSQLPLENAVEGPPFSFGFTDPQASFSAISALQSLEANPFEMAWEGKRRVTVTPLGPEALQVKVERQRDWFGLEGGAQVDGHRMELAVLLDAARRRQRFIPLEGGRWAELTEALRDRLASVADHAFEGTHGLETSPAATQALAELEDAGAQVSSDRAWQALAQRVAKAQSFDPTLPTGLNANLRDYQRDGFRWMARLAEWGAGACLADDMGLGKTLQTLALLLHRAQLGPALVVAPTSVCFNWREEAARFAPNLKILLYSEMENRTAKLKRLRAGTVLVVSYGLLTRDEEPFATKRFATLVLDEAQAVKNAQSLRARAVQRLDADFRVALSGTPLENHLGELWSLFRVTFPGLLGSWEQFRERYAGPIERAQDREASAGLARVVRPFLLRRTKTEVAKELPPKTSIMTRGWRRWRSWANPARGCAKIRSDSRYSLP